MKKILYTRYDTVGKFFCPCQVADTNSIDEFNESNRRACVRLNDPAKVAYIASIEIVHLGTFDDDTGKIELLPEPVTIAKCKDWLQVGDKNE